MSISLGDVVLYIYGDDGPLNSTLKKVESSTLSKINDLGKKVAIAFGTAALGVGIGVGKFLLSTIDPASDLNETVSKTKVVFGESADGILDWGKTTAASLGLSESSALSAAATYGNLFRAMNIGEDASADMSRGLVGLAGDLASFNNMDPAEVLDKLRAGLTGETEPLKTLGVNLNQALLEQRAFEMGLWDGNGALDAGVKAQAAYALIMEQTSLAQGDFSRTSDGLANQQRILKAKFEDLKATIGTALLPLATDLFSRFSDFVSKPETIAFIERLAEKIGDVADGFSKLLDGDVEGALTSIFGPEIASQIMPTFQAISDWVTNTMIPFVQEHWPEIRGALIGIGAALAAAGIVSIVTAIGAAISSLGLPVIALVVLAARLGQLWGSNWMDIQGKTQAAIEFVKGLIDGGLQFINDLVTGKLGLLSLIFTTAWSNIQLIFAAFEAALSGDWYRFGELLRTAWDNSWTLIKTILAVAWQNIQTGVRNGLQSIYDFFTKTDWGQVGKNILQGIANGLTSGLSIIRDAAVGAARAALEAAKGFLGISSPSKKFEDEVGEPSAEGFGVGFAKRMNEMGAGAEALSTFSGTQPAALGGGGGPIQFNYVDQRFISLSDEFDAERILAPIFERFLKLRGYQPVGAN